MNKRSALDKSPITIRMSELNKVPEDCRDMGVSLSALDHWKRASLGIKNSSGRIYNPPNGNNAIRLEAFLEVPDYRLFFPYHWPHLQN
jgi:hypothetical protein